MFSTHSMGTPIGATTAKGTRDRAKKLVKNRLDSDKGPKPDSSSDSHNSIQDLAQSFSELSLPNPHVHPGSEFVGGFIPNYPLSTLRPPPVIPLSLDGTHPSHRPLSQPNIQVLSQPQRPPFMPQPYPVYHSSQSLTMQMALRPQHEPISSSAPTVRPDSVTASASSSSLYSQPPTTPTKSTRPRVSSTPTSSGGTVSTQQCAGITKAGKQCSRQVKSRPALSNTCNPIESTTIERFCFQHTKELLEPSGFYARKDGLWVDFEYWIPQYLQAETQVALRVEMEKARSQSDVHGYIYTFEIRESHNAGTIKLKVGRAVNLVKRIDQWGKQCGSKEQILRGWYPGIVEADEDGGSLLKGRIRAGEKGPWCHRLERLVHLELADLAATSVYLDPAWPKSPAKMKVPTVNFLGPGQPCSDCGTHHKEIFELQKITNGRHKGKEWECVIKPVIERWGLFVSTYV